MVESFPFQTTEFGDLVTVHPVSHQEVWVSPSGKELLERSPQLIEFVGERLPSASRWYRDGTTSLNAQVNVGSFWKREYIGVKLLFPDVKMRGIDLFQAIRALERHGVETGAVLFASPDRLIHRWVEGEQVSHNSIYHQYIRDLKALADELRLRGEWKNTWEIDMKKSNYRIRSEQFIAIDPVYDPYMTDNVIR